MFRSRKYYNVDFSELNRRVRRQFEGNFSYRKIFIIIFFAAVFLLYIGPYIFNWLFSSTRLTKDPVARCLDDRLTPFYAKSAEFNALIQHYGRSDDPAASPIPLNQHFIPYVGNGWFGLEIDMTANLYVKYGRHLSQPINYYPVVSMLEQTNSADDADDSGDSQESIVVDYVNGIVHDFKCFSKDLFVVHSFYAHRVVPQVFVQEIRVTATKNAAAEVQLIGAQSTHWPNLETKVLKLRQSSSGSFIDVRVMNGIVDLPKSGEKLIISIVVQKLPDKISVRKRGIVKLDVLHVINYVVATASTIDWKQHIHDIESKAVETMTEMIQLNEFHFSVNDNSEHTVSSFKRQHQRVWNSLWETGFQISTSKADDAINGDRINATIYAVLSQVRSLEFESNRSPQERADIARALFYSEGCYDSYHTLQAGNLWKDMRTIEELNRLVKLWLLTLEKQGCHNLLKSGASGVLQAMILSVGGLRFSNQHLELNIHPKYLHRDYFFRRLNYGNMTHINISIIVTDDNRAIMYVALDRSDGQYYACDAGCLDDPISLSEKRTMFPVKLTEPLTAILYIASDKEHIEELQHAIHVKEVIEAPAHEHHVIALHKHGHQLGGLPTFFWVSICALIIVFHVFLCKLIVKEYCEAPEKLRYRYDKP